MISDRVKRPRTNGNIRVCLLQVGLRLRLSEAPVTRYLCHIGCAVLWIETSYPSRKGGIGTAYHGHWIGRGGIITSKSGQGGCFNAMLMVAWYGGDARGSGVVELKNKRNDIMTHVSTIVKRVV
jgi:hypothetical protein